MLDIFNQTTVPALEQVLNFAQARHNVLVGNIANMDTPGYRIRDMSVTEFQSRLSEAIEASKRRAQPISQGSDLTEADRAMQRVEDSVKDILHHDETDISLEKQILQISKNQSMHNTAIAIMTNQFQLLSAAISERV